MERLVETSEHYTPILLAFSDHVELLFHFGGEVEVHHRGEVLHEEIVHHHADIGGEELLFLRAGVLGGRDIRNGVLGKGEDAVGPFGPFAVLLDHVVLALHGTDGGRVGARAADAQFFELLHEAGFGVARCRPIETLRGDHLAQAEVLALLHVGQQAFLLLAVLIVLAFHIDLEETIEEDHFTRGLQGLSGTGADRDVDHRLLQFSIGHLAGERALPDEIVEAFRVAVGAGIAHHHIRWADGFVRLLRAFALAGVAARLAVAGAVLGADLGLGRRDGAFAQVHRIGTHVGDVPLLVQPLGDAHGAIHAVAELAAGFLLQR